jgi:hypothetical protein
MLTSILGTSCAAAGMAAPIINTAKTDKPTFRVTVAFTIPPQLPHVPSEIGSPCGLADAD